MTSLPDDASAGARRAGSYGAATSFVMRRFSDARVTRVPNDSELAALRECFPGSTVKMLVVVGQRLADHDQDIESYRYAIVNLAGVDTAEVNARWNAAQVFLPFEFIR